MKPFTATQEPQSALTVAGGAGGGEGGLDDAASDGGGGEGLGHDTHSHRPSPVPVESPHTIETHSSSVAPWIGHSGLGLGAGEPAAVTQHMPAVDDGGGEGGSGDDGGGHVPVCHSQDWTISPAAFMLCVLHRAGFVAMLGPLHKV